MPAPTTTLQTIQRRLMDSSAVAVAVGDNGTVRILTGPDTGKTLTIRQIVDRHTVPLKTLLEGAPGSLRLPPVLPTSVNDVIVFENGYVENDTLYVGRHVARVHDGLSGPIQIATSLARPTRAAVTKRGVNQWITIVDPASARMVENADELLMFVKDVFGAEWPGGLAGFIVRRGAKDPVTEVDAKSDDTPEILVNRLLDGGVFDAGDIEVFPRWTLPMGRSQIAREGLNPKNISTNAVEGAFTKLYPTHVRDRGYLPTILIIGDEEEHAFGKKTGKIQRVVIGAQPSALKEPQFLRDMATLWRPGKTPAIPFAPIFSEEAMKIASEARIRRQSPAAPSLAQNDPIPQADFTKTTPAEATANRTATPTEIAPEAEIAIPSPAINATMEIEVTSPMETTIEIESSLAAPEPESRTPSILAGTLATEESAPDTSSLVGMTPESIPAPTFIDAPASPVHEDPSSKIQVPAVEPTLIATESTKVSETPNPVAPRPVGAMRPLGMRRFGGIPAPTTVDVPEPVEAGTSSIAEVSVADKAPEIETTTVEESVVASTKETPFMEKTSVTELVANPENLVIVEASSVNFTATSEPSVVEATLVVEMEPVAETPIVSTDFAIVTSPTSETTAPHETTPVAEAPVIEEAVVAAQTTGASTQLAIATMSTPEPTVIEKAPEAIKPAASTPIPRPVGMVRPQGIRRMGMAPTPRPVVHEPEPEPELEGPSFGM